MPRSLLSLYPRKTDRFDEMLACLRSLGLAARYMNGYLLTQPPPGQPRLIGAEAAQVRAGMTP